MRDCIFCQIINGTAHVSLIHRDEVVWVFLSTLPANPGHTLVIPRQHVRLLQEMDEPTGRHLFTITMRTQQALRKSSLRCEAATLFLADGTAASQAIPHLHLHVIPRFVDDGFKLNATGGVTTRHSPVPREQLDSTAEGIRQTYEALWRDHTA